ncbi:hypothetical protein BUALT_Bualt19G0064700 [Buddleja alternifolia]|uniref:Transposase n=1 Tax=Buddleja alternifolia TaxID=168488 RepID=A0AAV6W7Z6_9LAMI|nr:hypothetical protein BUALT_Bualt19G0064700 [Buddleja alternifolia]
MAEFVMKKIEVFLVVEEIMLQSIFLMNMLMRRLHKVNLRMDRGTFVRLCYLLEHVGGLVDSRYVTIQEKGCLGALDGTYIKVTVPEIDKARYRTRKSEPSVNVLGVCDPKMMFIYSLTGWEGSTVDSRVLRDALNRPHGLRVPRGNYYLCDNGYTNGDGFLTPYKGVRYHLNDWGEGSMVPQNSRELFNMNHSTARNVVERSFGLLKKQWAVLRSPTFYPIKIQNRIIMACILLHNFIHMEMSVDPLEHELDDMDLENELDHDVEFIETIETSHKWSSWRDSLATSMYNEWRGARFLFTNVMEASSAKLSRGSRKKGDKSRRSWSQKEEEVLIAALKEIISSGWKAENGFKIGYLQTLEQHVVKAFPSTDIRAMPCINSKIHVWKKNYGSLVSMLYKSGIGWNDTTKMIEAHDEAWDSYVETDSNARLMRYKSWPYYADWVEVFGGTDTIHVEKQNEEDLEHQFEGLGGFADETETMSACPTNSSTSGKRSKGKKRKSMDGQDPMYQLMGTFCQNTDVRLGEIAQRIGYDYDVSKARKEIYGVVGKIEGLSLQHKLKVSRLLAKNTEDLELFLNLDDVGKAKFVQMTLGGQF